MILQYFHGTHGDFNFQYFQGSGNAGDFVVQLIVVLGKTYSNLIPGLAKITGYLYPYLTLGA